MALYNTTYYNADQYNLTADLLALSESIAPADDTIVKSILFTRQESMAEIDTIGSNIGPDELMDMIALMDIRTMSETLVQADTMSFADAVANTFLQGILSETITLADTLSQYSDAAFSESVFVDENTFRAEITNKALSDTIRLAEWFSIERNPQTSEWSD